MIWGFAVIVVLVGALLIPNALYAFRQFLGNRDFLWLAVYLSFLALLGYLLIHVTTRTAELVQSAKDTYAEPDPEAVGRRL